MVTQNQHIYRSKFIFFSFILNLEYEVICRLDSLRLFFYSFICIFIQISFPCTGSQININKKYNIWFGDIQPQGVSVYLLV